jgi:hypothetical protein
VAPSFARRDSHPESFAFSTPQRFRGRKNQGGRPSRVPTPGSTCDCGVPVLNEWLMTRASQFEKKDLARTNVLVEIGDVAV